MLKLCCHNLGGGPNSAHITNIQKTFKQSVWKYHLHSVDKILMLYKMEHTNIPRIHVTLIHGLDPANSYSSMDISCTV